MSRLSKANKPELIKYIPSGKYPSYAPFIFIPVLFILTSISGLIYGYIFSEFTTALWLSHWYPGIAPSVLILGVISGYSLIFLLICNSVLVLTRILKIRNPEAVRRWTMYATCPWWFFTWIGLYLTSGSELGIFSFVWDRLQTGVVVGLTLRGPPILFQVQWYVLIVVWFIEAGTLPLVVRSTALVRARYPFSEKSESWYTPIKLPDRMYSPTWKEIQQNTSNSEFNWIILGRSNRYDKKEGTDVVISFPDFHKNRADPIYASFERIFVGDISHQLLASEEVEVLIKKFDPEQKTEAIRRLEQV